MASLYEKVEHLKRNQTKIKKEKKIDTFDKWLKFLDEKPICALTIPVMKKAIQEILGEGYDILSPPGRTAPYPRYVVDQERVVHYKGRSNRELLYAVLEGKRAPKGTTPDFRQGESEYRPRKSYQKNKKAVQVAEEKQPVKEDDSQWLRMDYRTEMSIIKQHYQEQINMMLNKMRKELNAEVKVRVHYDEKDKEYIELQASITV